MMKINIPNCCFKAAGMLLLMGSVSFTYAANGEIFSALEQAVQKQTPQVESVSAADVLKEHRNRLATVTLSADLPGRYWAVTCRAVLTGKTSLTLDNPCTELLATAFTENAPASILVNMGALGSFKEGKYKGEDFFYAGKVYPDNFKVLKNGYAVYQVPVKEPEAVNTLLKLSPITLEPAQLSALFHKLPAPTSQVSFERGGGQIKYKKADVAPYQAFLTQLEKDIAGLMKHFYVYADLSDCSGYFDKPFPAKGFITSPKGTVVLAENGNTPEGSAVIYIEDLKRTGATDEQICLYITMPGLGEYEDGKTFYSVQPPLAPKAFQLAGKEAFSFTMRLPAQKPVAQKLNNPQMRKLFNQHVITDLWLQHYPPRIQRALEFIP